MPFQPILPTWLSLNNGNFTSPTGLTDPITGQQVQGGGLYVGDFFDLTTQEASQLSYTTNGLLYAGRYRFVQVDSGATAANVKTGTIGYLRAGNTVKTAIILTAGSGQTAGTYQINANAGSGGGSGAVLSVVVGSGGTITNVSVVAGGFNYTSAPTFTVAAGGTPGTVQAQLSSSLNLVTSYDQTGVTGVGTVRPVVFLNPITPGNYGFIQEQGIATVLGAAAVGDNTIGDWVDSTTAGVTVARTSTANSPIGATVGRAVDPPQNNSLFKIVIYGPLVQD